MKLSMLMILIIENDINGLIHQRHSTNKLSQCFKNAISFPLAAGILFLLLFGNIRKMPTIPCFVAEDIFQNCHTLCNEYNISHHGSKILFRSLATIFALILRKIFCINNVSVRHSKASILN